MPTKSQYYPYGGGLDVVTPALSLKPGRAIIMVNYEPWFNGGYRRIDGFERFDGRPRPSEQTFIGFNVNGSEDVVVGTVITGGTSLATGTVIGKYEDDGSFGSDTLAITKVTGTFVDGETIGVAGTNFDDELRPDAAITDTGSNLASGAFGDIDEGVSFAESETGLFCPDEVPSLQSVEGLWAAGTIDIPISDVDIAATTINSWTLRVRARVLRAGPETDDTAIYRFTFAPTGDSETIDFTEGDVGADWITRTVTEAVSAATPAAINAALISLSQAAFVQNGNGDDLLKIEIDCVDVIIDYDGATTIRSAPVARYASDQDNEDTFLIATFEEYRGDIAVVPGANQVRGAWRRLADSFAIRDNVGVTAGILHLASAAGWVTAGVTLVDTLFYDAGTDAAVVNFILEGDTITGLGSGASATVHRVLIHAGSPGGADAEGYLALTGVAGGPFTDNESLQIGGSTVADARGVNSTFALTVGGRYQFANHNFFGGAATYRVYACSGNGDPAIEIDESNIVTPILFPMTTVTGQPVTNEPFLIEEHRNHLFMAFPGGRALQSVQGEPLNFNGFLGAAEFGMGDELTGLNSVVGGPLIFTSERETRGLFGKDIDDWELRLIGERTGGRVYTAEKLDTVYALDDLGITSIQRTDAFGDFVGATVSQLIQPLIDLRREGSTAATIVRSSNQYRVYFDNNDAFIMYVPAAGGVSQVRGTQTRIQVQFGIASYPFVIRDIWTTDDENGTERRYFATDDVANEGFVFEDGIGTSFDGAKIQSFLRTAYNFVGSPALRKRFRRAFLELNASKPLTLRVSHDLSFGSTEASGNIDDIEIEAGGGFWDTDNWDEVFWDGQNISSATAILNGTGENISFLIFNESEVSEPFILQGLTLHYDPRRIQR